MTPFSALALISLFISIAFATVSGRLLDYGFFETYQIALTTFTLSDPFSWFVLVVLYSPLVLALIALAIKGLAAFEENTN